MSSARSWNGKASPGIKKFQARGLGTLQGAAPGNRFPPKVPSGGLFATQRCHRVESRPQPVDCYAADARYRRAPACPWLLADADEWVARCDDASLC
jgi:hypothetical protein